MAGVSPGFCPTVPLLLAKTWQARCHRTVAPAGGNADIMEAGGSGFRCRIQHFDGKRVNATRQFVGQRIHYGTVAGEPGQRSENGARYAHAKMRIAALAPAGVTVVTMAFVNHFKMARHEFDRKFFDNGVANRHIPTVSAVAECGA